MASTHAGEVVASGGPAPREGPRPASQAAAGPSVRIERFNHRCADAEPLQVQAYAEVGARDGRGKALVIVYVRRNSMRSRELFIGLRLVAMRMEAGRERVQANWSVRLDARAGTIRHLGPDHAHFISSPSRSERRRRAFRSDETGTLDWLDSAEPVGRIERGEFPCNWSPRLETRADALGLTEENRDVALGLVLTDARTGKTVRLSGAAIRVPDRMWRELPASSKVTDFIAKLRAAVGQGGRPNAGRRARCRKCGAERRRAMRAFSSS